ncbi:hypothetical protein ACO0SA_003278 [Hanseniaspora valbyensis]
MSRSNTLYEYDDEEIDDAIMTSIPIADFDVPDEDDLLFDNNGVASSISMKRVGSTDSNFFSSTASQSPLITSWGMGLSNSLLPDNPETNFIIKKQQKVFKKYESKFLHILKKIKLFNLFINILIPIITLFYLLFKIPAIAQFSKKFVYLVIINYVVSICSLFLGYHKYFAHRSFELNTHSWIEKPVLFTIAVFGVGIGFGSIIDFKTYHLLHHQQLDTVTDPLNYELGWLFHQWGHLLFKGKKKFEIQFAKNKEINIKRYKNDSVVNWQHLRRYQLMFLNMIAFPLIVSYLMKIPKWNCIFWLSFFKFSLIQQQWLLTETIGHIYPIFLSKDSLSKLKLPFVNSTNDMPLILHYLLALLVFGETNHNFHHAFPNDYRQSFKWYYLDFQKWIIWILHKLNIISKVYKVNNNHILKYKLENEQKLIDYELNYTSNLNKTVSLNDLPIWSVEQFAYRSNRLWKEKKIALVLIEGIIHDVTSFINGHPGGEQLIVSAIGKDATEAFNGGVYYHSNASRNLMANMRIGVLITENNGVWGTKKKHEGGLEYRKRMEIVKFQNGKKFFAPMAA